jgi:hypothetical protein
MFLVPAATIGQVHGAVLLNGERVVIKVQYPEVEKLFTQDLKARSYCVLSSLLTRFLLGEGFSVCVFFLIRAQGCGYLLSPAAARVHANDGGNGARVQDRV